MDIKIFIADDHKIIRDGLRSLIARQKNLEVVGEACDGRTAVKLVRELTPHVVIMDIAMPDLNGLEATRKVVAADPDVKVIALSMHSDRRYVSQMLKAGAKGYLLKECAFEELYRAIEAVVAGKVYLSPGIAGVVVEDYVKNEDNTESSCTGVLSAREREVLQLISEGKTTKETALCLHLSAKTVESHRRNIMSKLDMHSLAELTKYAIREGVTTVDP